MPKTPALPARAETPAVVSLALVSVSSVTCAAPLKTAVTRPMSASSFMTGWPTRTPSLEPLSMLIVAYQTVGEVADDAAGLRAVVLQPERAARLEQLAHLAVLVQRVVADRELRAQAVALGGQVLDLALGVQRVAEPAEEVAHGLQRAARALLHRVEHLARAALHPVQGAAAGLAEVRGQEDQGADDEQSEDCPAPPDRLVVHVGDDSKALW